MMDLTQAYKNLFPGTSASILEVTTLRNSLSMYVFLLYNNFFLIACFVNSSPKVTFWVALVFSLFLYEHRYATSYDVPFFCLNRGIRI
jgi:hypothetical protein